jgi:hypothetical protein
VKVRRYGKTIAIVTAVAVIALSVVAVAYGATRTTRRAAGNSTCGALMSNPKAVKAMQALRAEHQKEMQAWKDKYGADPTSAEALAEHKRLREEHWNDMRGLFKELGLKAPTGPGPGGMMRGSGGCGGACGAAGSGASAAGQGAGYGMMGAGYGMMGGGTY